MAIQGNRFRSALLASTSLLAGGVAPAAAQTVLPTHGVVASGAASIGQTGSNLTVKQTSARAVVNWNSFSIGQGDRVTFVQPNSSSATLNRVTGSTTSAIAGQLNANGQVYLINPNGIAITRSGAVRVGGGFVASTLGITDGDFNNGALRFSGAGASAAVSNAGSIIAGPGGFVGLLGGGVANSGMISVPLGKVAMGSGEQATLDLTGDGFLQVAVPTKATSSDGRALIDVSGKVHAAGGVVEMRAATAANAVRNAINLSGVASANSAHASGGVIVLDGGAGGRVAVTGGIGASGRKAGAIHIAGRNVALGGAKIAARSGAGIGGKAEITATNTVALAATTIDVSGAAGGGVIAVGGDRHGAGPLVNAKVTAVDGASLLKADALGDGNGGSVTVWSDRLTNFAGRVSARGGPHGGNGGEAEVSSNSATMGVLNYAGFADLTAPWGAVGGLLLDPFDIVISTGANTCTVGCFPGGVYTPASTSVINTTTLETQLANSDVTITTGAVGIGRDAGNITVSAPINWASNNGLTLTAANVVNVNAAITNTGAGGLTLNAANGVQVNSPLSFGAGAVAFNGPTDLTANVTTAGGAVTFAGTANVDFSSAPGSGGAVAVTTSGGPISFNNTLTIRAGLTVNSGAGTTAFAGAIDTGFSDSCAGACDLTASAGTMTFGGVLGGAGGLGAVTLTSTNGMTLPTIDATSIQARTTGAAADLTLAPPTVLTASAIGTAVALGAGRGFVNQAGAGAINLTGSTSRWLIYSANPANDVFGGLNSNNRAAWNTPFGGAVATAGNVYAFAFQPTLTFTSTNDTKTYGQNAATAVALDYTVSAPRAGVVGAYLGDTPGTAFNGAPSVTSPGSAATASVAGGPYVINVAAGSLTSPSGYAFAFASTGRLVVNPEPITITAAPNTKIFDGATEAAATPIVTVGTLFDPATLTESYATRNAGAGLTLTPAAAIANAGNYVVTLASAATGVINPEPITITAAANTKVYDGTVAAAATPTVTAGALFDPATLSETYGAANAGAGLTLNPAAAIANAGNYVVTLASANTGVITPRPLTYGVANTTSTYGTTAALGAPTLAGVLPGDLVTATVGAFSGGAPVALGPRTAAGVYAEDVTGLSNPNYAIAAAGNAPGVLTINPLALTFSVANANSIFGTQAILGATTLAGVLPGDTVNPTTGVFSGGTPIAPTATTPPGIYRETVIALDNPNYAIAVVGNAPGVLRIGSTFSIGLNPSTVIPGSIPTAFPHPGGAEPSDPGIIETTLGGGGSVTLDGGGWSAPGACATGFELPDVSRYADPVEAVKAISDAMSAYFERCRNPSQADLADALDRYAGALSIIAPRLPPSLRNLPRLVANAAQRVRAAPNRAAAVKILREAAAEVHKQITLARADNPDALRVQTRVGDLVAGTLEKTAVTLVRAEGI